MENSQPLDLSERIKEALYHGMKALDEMRAKTLIYNKYRDTQRVADAISDVLKEIKKNEQKHQEEGLQLGNN